jgi:hypothetical protein
MSQLSRSASVYLWLYLAECWCDWYRPQADLAVHKRKVEDVRRWLLEAFDGGPTGKLRKYRVCLVLFDLSMTQSYLVHVLTADSGPHWACWYRKDHHNTCVSSRDGFRNRRVAQQHERAQPEYFYR